MSRPIVYRGLVFGILLLSLTACQQSQPAAEPPFSGEAPTPTEEAAAEGAPAGEAKAGGEAQPVLESNIDALEALDSYTYEFAWSWQQGSAVGLLPGGPGLARRLASGAALGAAPLVGSFVGSGEAMNTPYEAEHILWNTVDAQGAEASLEWILIDEPVEGAGFYFRTESDAVWTYIPSGTMGIDPSSMGGFNLSGFWGSFVFNSPADYSFVGAETVNGVQANHFRSGTYSYLSGIGCAPTEGESEIWIAAELDSLPVRQSSHFAGVCNDQAYEWTFTSDLIPNAPVDISPPENVQEIGISPPG